MADGGRRAPGFRFYPTEEELICFYLRNKLDGLRDDIERVIPVFDVYSVDPLQLSEIHHEMLGGGGEGDPWFYFCPRQEREARGGRPSRTTPSGYWKSAGTLGVVYSADRRPIDHGVLPRPRAVGDQNHVEDERVQSIPLPRLLRLRRLQRQRRRATKPASSAAWVVLAKLPMKRVLHHKAFEAPHKKKKAFEAHALIHKHQYNYTVHATEERVQPVSTVHQIGRHPAIRSAAARRWW